MGKLVKKSGAAEPSFMANVRRLIELADERKAEDIKAYDVRGLTLIADVLLLCSATSEPHMKAVYQALRNGMKEIGIGPLHAEGDATSAWVVLDYGDIIVHLFRENARQFYDLDGLWADAPLLEREEARGGV